MVSLVGSFARRLADDEYFLASALRVYALSEQLDDSGLANVLGCDVETLDPLGLCRRPSSEPDVFQRDVDRIALHFGVDTGVLAQVVRRADVIGALRRDANNEWGLLMAARDRSEKTSEPEDPGQQRT